RYTMRMNIRVVLLLLIVLPCGASAADPAADRRDQVRRALETVERGQSLGGDQRRALLRHPLYRYVEYAELRRGLEQATAESIEGFIARYADLPLLPRLRDAWLQELARRGEWKQVVARAADADSAEARCHLTHARIRLGADAQAWQAAEGLWRSRRSAPSACDPVFAALQSAGKLDEALRWERIELAAAEGNPGLMRYLAL